MKMGKKRENKINAGAMSALAVLVGTFRKENAEWIKEKKLYNLPLPPCGKVAFHENISRVVLIADGFKSVAYEARFSEVVDAAWLKENGYKVAAADKAHGSSYALYKLGEELSFAATLSNPAADVFVLSQRCPNVKIDKEFYQKPYPKTGGKSMPYIFDKLKQYFKKWHSAITFNPVQLDFFSGLLGEDKSVPFPGVENPRFTFIDLFAGIGGFHLAMEELGGKCVFASEWDKDAQDTYERNYGIRPCGDIKKIDEKSIPKHDVLCAGFPCQPFSKAGPQTGFEDETKGTLFFDIERILKHHKTKYIILENVRNLVSHDNGRTWKTIYSHLVKLGYRLTETPLIVSPHNFGIPQLRERVVVLGVYDPINRNKPLHVTLPPSCDKGDCSLDSILEKDNKDPEYKLTKDEEDIINIWDEFYRGIKEKVIGFPIWLEWFKKEPPLDEGEMPEWKRSFVKKNNALYLNNKDFIDKWLWRHDNLERFTPTMRKMEWQCGKAVSSAWDAFLQMRPSGLRIKRPDCAPALVAIVQVPIIGKYRRRMTVREAARLQSFDDRFIPNANKHQAYKQFGNAVNVTVIRECARRLFEYE